MELNKDIENQANTFSGATTVQSDWSLLLAVGFHLVTTIVSGFIFISLGTELDLRQYESFHEYISVWPRIRETNELSVWAQWASWDAGNYLQIASTGYEPGSPLNAFYPLWPALIWPASLLGGTQGAFFWGLLLSNLLFFSAVMALSQWIQNAHGKRISRLTIGLIVCFPGTIYFSLIYTESLFFFLSVLAMYSLSQRRIGWLILGAFLLPLSKAIGIFILIPLMTQVLRKRITPWIVLAPLMGYLAYFFFFMVVTGNPLAGFLAQGQFLNQPSISKIFDLPAFLNAFGNGNQWIHPTHGFLDRMMFLAFCLTIPDLLMRQKFEVSLYCLAIGIVPALSNHLLSYFRFFVVCFPIFITWALIYDNRKLPQWVFGLLLSLFFISKLLMLKRYLSFQWVG